MSEVVVDKPLNLRQLGMEIGGSPQFRMSETSLWSDVDQAVLEEAVAAHVADPTILPPPPPAPLVDPTERPDEDEVAASIALLTEDSVGYRAVVGLLLAKGIVTQAEVGAAMAKATERLVVLADNPEARRAMMAQRLANAEALRG